jgi:hypothetical protein
MPPPIIQDSDDEDGSDGSPVKPRSPPTHLQHATSASDPSTTSTTALSNEAQKTHRNLMGLTPSPHHTVQTTASSAFPSPDTLKIMRPKTTMDQVGTKRKVQKMYGSKTTLGDLGLNEGAVGGDRMKDDDEEVDLIPEKKNRKRTGEDLSTSTEKTEVATQEPMPSMGSQVLGGSQQASGSISLSQMVDSALDHLQTVPSPEVAFSVEHGDMQGSADAGLAASAEETVQLRNPRSEISMETPSFSPIEVPSPYEDQVTSKTSDDQESARSTQISSRGDQPQHHENKFENSLNRKKSETKATSKARRKISISEDHEEDPIGKLGSDDFDMHTPKEVYKPRPSRSRRSDIPDEFMASIDFSMVPERASRKKSKLKRNKTTNDIPSPILIEDDDEDDGDLVHSGRRSSKKKQKQSAAEPLEGKEGLGVESALDAEETITCQAVQQAQDQDEADEDEETAEYQAEAVPEVPEPKKKKRGRPRKDASTSNQSVVEAKVEKTLDEEDGQQQAAAAPAPKKRGRKKKVLDAPVESKQVVSDDGGTDEEDQVAKDDHEEAAAEPESDHEPTPAPRKRGRPRSKVQAHPDSVEDSLSTTKPARVEPVLRDKSSAANIVHTPEPEKSKANLSEEKAASPVPDLTAKELQTPKKPTDSSKGKHSPLSSGRVPYRVGLSKRARIEPLLRIVRK